MEAKEYSELALRTAKEFEGKHMDLMHAAAGMAGEAGEVVDVVKKIIFYGNPVDRTHLIEEMGDQLWYINLMINRLGTTWSEVFEVNIAKIEARYPGLRFDPSLAINRNTQAESEAINKVL